jgi:nitrate reductase (NAD(P)H)
MEASTEIMDSPTKSSKELSESNLPPTPPESTIGDTAVCPTPANEPEFPLPPVAPSVQILDLDKATPDAHVPRDPRLIRLTGVHPFNVEAPLKDLYDEGFLTSPNLFYVRNHGPVPMVEDDEIFHWTFAVEGYMKI